MRLLLQEFLRLWKSNASLPRMTSKITVYNPKLFNGMKTPSDWRLFDGLPRLHPLLVVLSRPMFPAQEAMPMADDKVSAMTPTRKETSLWRRRLYLPQQCLLLSSLIIAPSKITALSRIWSYPCRESPRAPGR